MEIGTIYVHIGYPKTATTTLQESILFPLSQQGKINYLGILGFTKDDEIKKRYNLLRPLIRGLEAGNNSSKPLSSDRKINEEQFDQANFSVENLGKVSKFLNNKIPNVLSDEAILIPNVSLHGFKSTANRLRKIFPSSEVKIIVTLRSQSTLIPSFYAEKYKYLYQDPDYNSPEKAFFHNKELKSGVELIDIFNFYEVAKTYADVFGKDNISFLFYEKLLEDSNYYRNQFIELLDIDFPNVETEKQKPENYRIKSKTKTGEYQIMVERKFPFSSKRVKRLVQALPFGPQLLNKKITVPNFTKEQIQIIRNNFAKSNEQLAMEYSLDIEFMQKHNYLI